MPPGSCCFHSPVPVTAVTRYITKEDTMEVAIKNPDTKEVAFSARFKPRPIMATNSTDEFCLTIKQESLAKIWRFNKEEKRFEFIVSAQIKI